MRLSLLIKEENYLRSGTCILSARYLVDGCQFCPGVVVPSAYVATWNAASFSVWTGYLTPAVKNPAVACTLDIASYYS